MKIVKIIFESINQIPYNIRIICCLIKLNCENIYGENYDKQITFKIIKKFLIDKYFLYNIKISLNKK